MTLETQLRDQLRRHTDDVVGGPDLTTSLRLGRSRRRVRAVVATGGATLATAAVVSLALVLPRSDDGTTLQPHGSLPTDSPLAAKPSSPAPAGDFIPGTDRDERLVATVSRHLPDLPAPDDVYPSDVNTAGPLPDEAYARATDFQATYTIGPGHTLLVFTGYGPVGEDPGERGVVTTQVNPGDDGSVTSTTFFVFADGFSVSALETVGLDGGPGQDQAPVRGLVRDPALKFPAPPGVTVQH